MRRLGIFGATAVAALALAAGSAQAQAAQAAAPKPFTGPIASTGLTVQEIAAWVQDQGYKAEIGTLDNGEKYVNSASDGVKFQIYLYDCKSTPHCSSIQFAAGFTMDKPGLPGGAAKINEWNNTKRYIQGHIDDENNPWFQYDVNLAPGGTYEALDDNFAFWLGTLGDFRKFINPPEAPAAAPAANVPAAPLPAPKH